MQFKKFWIVIADSDSFQYRFREFIQFPDENAANKHAEMSARDTGIPMHVFEVVSRCKKADVQWEQAAELPF